MKKLTLTDVEKILDRRYLDVPNKNLAKKRLFQDLLMDDVDFMNLALDVESICGISIPDELVDEWLKRKLSLTVEEVINDCNALIE